MALEQAAISRRRASQISRCEIDAAFRDLDRRIVNAGSHTCTGERLTEAFADAAA